MFAETSVRSSLSRVLTVGVLIGACFASVQQTQAQNSASDYYYRQGNALLSERQYDAAIAAYGEAIKINPNSVGSYLVSVPPNASCGAW